jgi:hypothetical protein
MKFVKKTVGTHNNAEHTWMNTMVTVGDINGDGLPDIAIAGGSGKLAWFENPGARDGGWKDHPIAMVDKVECGGSVYDITGNGRGDLIIGSGGGRDILYWYENKGAAEWVAHQIAQTGRNQFHDTLVARTARDSKPALYFTNQGGGTAIYRVEIPANPHQFPWPGIEKITEGKYLDNPDNPWGSSGIQPEEGLAVGDVDNDGEIELVCGTHWYKYTAAGWQCYKFGTDFISTKVAVADINGDGKNEIILTEGDACCYGKKSARMAWYSPGADIHAPWQEHLLFDDLLDPHTLRVGDIAGNGHADILVGELGKLVKGTDEWDVRKPQIFVLKNDGAGTFEKVLVDEGTSIHDGFLVDVDGDGKLDIVGRPLFGHEKWNMQVYYQS